METIILPGFSPKNQQWAEETRDGLKSLGPVSVAYWEHWQTGDLQSNWIEKETNKLVESIHGKHVNIIAKSIGSLIAMYLLRQIPNSINKLILCGIPLLDLSEENKRTYKVLVGFPPDKVLCIQNNDDNHGNYSIVEKFVHKLNANMPIISKPRNDHEYPYSDDFIGFLK